jgi:hypothetical protein
MVQRPHYQFEFQGHVTVSQSIWHIEWGKCCKAATQDISIWRREVVRPGEDVTLSRDCKLAAYSRKLTESGRGPPRQ